MTRARTTAATMRAAARGPALLATALLAVSPAATVAGDRPVEPVEVLRDVDAAGVPRFTDSAAIVPIDGVPRVNDPAAAVPRDGTSNPRGSAAQAGQGRRAAVATPDADAPRAAARLVLETAPAGTFAFVENRLAGPIEVMLDAGTAFAGSDPPLPARARVPAHGRALVAVLPATVVGVDGSGFRLDTVPGDPNATPRDVEYAWPLEGAALRIAQGWGGRFSHADAENRHAVDFAVPVGTPVLAARAGVVMQVEAGFAGAGLDAERDPGRANFVRILHDDGTMAQYAHLRRDGVTVRPGDHVARGQQVGWSGDTGFSGGPHLHFVVQANRGMRLESLPFRMFGPQGVLRFSPGAGAR